MAKDPEEWFRQADYDLETAGDLGSGNGNKVFISASGILCVVELIEGIRGEMGEALYFCSFRFNVTGSDNYNKVLSGLPSYATKSPCLEDQGFIFPASSTV